MSSLFFIHPSVKEPLAGMFRRTFASAKTFSDSGEISSGDVFLCDISGLKETFLRETSLKGARIYICGDADSQTESLLLEAGVAHAAAYRIYESRMPEIFSYPDELAENILLIGADEKAETILKSIAGSFGYSCDTASTIDEAAGLMQKKYALVIHDLSFAEIPLLQFVKRMSHSPLKSVPYISYKSSGPRIDVNDLQSGIKNLTRVILSRNECFAHTAVILFKNRYFPFLLKAVNLFGSDVPVYGEESLKKIFFTHFDSFFSDSPGAFVSAAEKSEEMFAEMKNLYGRFSLLSWLVEKHSPALSISEADGGKHNRR